MAGFTGSSSLTSLFHAALRLAFGAITLSMPISLIPRKINGATEDGRKVLPLLRAFTLCHASQIEGIPPYLPPSVELEVTRSDPGLRGDTASAATKPATLETGLVIQVPPFVNEGDKVRVILVR